MSNYETNIPSYLYTSQEKTLIKSGSSYSNVDLLVANASLNRSRRRSRKRQIYEFVVLLKNHFDTNSHSHTDIWGYLFYMSRYCDHLYMTQEHIGKQANILRPQANININSIVNAGLLFKQYRGVKKTCSYELPAVTKDIQFMEEISDLFPWVRGMVYKYQLLSRFKPLDANRTQVLNIDSKKAISKKECTFFYNNYLQQQPCEPLYQTNQHIQLVLTSEWTSKEYAQLALAIGACN